jgi:hypothetical protein
MARPHETRHAWNATLTPSAALDAPPSDPADPRTFGLVKAAYSVRETLYVLSIGRTSLYAAVKRGELTSTKFRRKTLFLATDLAAFLARLGQHNGSL